jgi:RNA recognition motif-containing protein
MTIDDDRSIYIGGLPYNASEDTLRRVFNLYGSIVAVKVINSSVLTSNSTINKEKK